MPVRNTARRRRLSSTEVKLAARCVTCGVLATWIEFEVTVPQKIFHDSWCDEHKPAEPEWVLEPIRRGETS